MLSEKYADIGTLNHALNNGISSMVKWMKRYYGKSIEEMGIPSNFSFYSARHSWATIARNDCEIPTHIVDMCLCHAGQTIADRSYVKKDYAFVDDANTKVMKFVFGE